MLVLASSSPRRQELLRLITDDFEILTANTDESLPPGTSPKKAVITLARRKALAIARLRPESVVIGADTVVALKGRILGKPRDKREAAEMLALLSNKTHTVYTGCCIVSPKRREIFFEATKVRFLKLSKREIAGYVASGDPMDKAGAYGIQGGAALFISGISGDFYNVMGLPVAKLNRKLERFGHFGGKL